jgi:hypothetical protein
VAAVADILADVFADIVSAILRVLIVCLGLFSPVLLVILVYFLNSRVFLLVVLLTSAVSFVYQSTEKSTRLGNWSKPNWSKLFNLLGNSPANQGGN